MDDFDLIYPELDKTIQKVKKKGGPYSRSERDSRREIVFRLFFECNQTIYDMAKRLGVNRHTVESDVKFWYNELGNTFKKERENIIVKYLNRLENQQIRVQYMIQRREVSTVLSGEKLTFQINSKILDTLLALEKSK